MMIKSLNAKSNDTLTATVKGKKPPKGVSNEMRAEHGRNRAKLVNQFGATGLKGKGR